jgi:hypothetical protein
MSIESEISRLQNAKSALKTQINTNNDGAHQIINETLDNFAGFIGGITNSTDYQKCLDIANAILDGYTILPYIESSGTQYIDTGFSPDQDSRMVLDFQPSNTNAAVYAGCRAGNGTTRAFTINSGSGQSRPFYFAMDGSGNTVVGTLDTDRHVADMNKTSFVFDNVAKTTPTIENFTALNTIYLFACSNNDTGTVNLQASCKIFSCKIYDDGVLVRDYIPVQKNSNNEVCMYDRVSNTFYSNAGTGTFIAGEEVSE